VRRLAEANARWHRILDSDPGNELAIAQIADNFITHGELAEATRWIERLSARQGSRPTARLHELAARHALQKGDVPLALSRWREAVTEGGVGDGHATFTMGNRFLAADQIDAARACVELLGGNAASAARERLLRAKCLMHERRWSEAIALLEDDDRFGSLATLARDLLYRCYMSDYRHDSAAALCDSLGGDASYRRGKAQFKQHRFREAMESFSREVERNDHADSKVWLIRALYAVGELDAAKAEAARHDATEGVDPLTRARCWEAAGLLESAEACYRAAAETGEDPARWLALATFQYTYRYWDRAWRTIALAERDGHAHPALARMKHQLRDAFRTLGFRPARWSRRSGVRELRSSEAAVSAIVERLLARPAPTSPGRRRSAARPARVALVINSLGPGGAERQAVNLANGLVRRDRPDDVSMWCTYLDRVDQDRFYLGQLDERVHVAQYYDRSLTLRPEDVPELADHADLLAHVQPPSRQQLMLQMGKTFAAARPDVVHGWLDETFINTALICTMLGIETVVGRWGSMPPGVNRTVTERDRNNIEYLQDAYRSIARLPALRYSSNSRLTGAAYAELMGLDDERVRTIYNGIDEDALRRSAAESGDLRGELGIPGDAIVIGTVFRMSEEKRPMLWTDVAAKLSDLDPRLHFVIVGAGPLECQVVERAERHGLENIHLVGKQINIGAWMTMFDIFLLTSRVEGVSNAVVEAQFCGCPVIAPDVGGLSEAMRDGHTGFLLDAPETDDFVTVVHRLVEDVALRERMRAQARRFARSKFSIPTLVSEYRTLFGLATRESPAPTRTDNAPARHARPTCAPRDDSFGPVRTRNTT